MKAMLWLLMQLLNTGITGAMYFGALDHPDATLGVQLTLGMWFLGNALAVVSLFFKEKLDDVQRKAGPGE